MKILDPRYRTPIHVLYGLLVVAAIGLSVPRLFLKNQPRTRANIIALGIGAKSLVILSYQVLTERVGSLRKYGSLKANTILNGLEIVFWGAVTFLVTQANFSSCSGIGCGLSWTVGALAILLSNMAMYLFLLSYKEFRASRRARSERKTRASAGQSESDSGTELGARPEQLA